MFFIYVIYFYVILENIRLRMQTNFAEVIIELICGIRNLLCQSYSVRFVLIWTSRTHYFRKLADILQFSL